ncbi:MAG: hypothetical protein G01um101418_590 [Parcubacteria group bacterium Gr01-1014_18]|nr:MAG: hypothetical protein Greene041636_119 [Parcubacteria group bacterium Greene0416_36]TSC80842.1 MAG: hypothetical protein G01um101418_590 [Parcubacteria group bacterium Gr01-1014_18]TSC99503.1 MAG: hypothetical protein Greene101420_170 [Parcubacteria group bacterium Greene1014_20]TSD07578.1 MAG: hypothetical protein Greene07142_35 [Parcubacteria group bacterium Greene0714_2]
MIRPLELLFSFSFLFFPLWAEAAGPDFAVGQADISVSAEKLEIGKSFRAYATIHNKGEADAKGYAAFFIGNVAIGTEQPLSIRAAGSDEAFVDGIVPATGFTISVKVVSEGESDANPENNSAESKSFEVVPSLVIPPVTESVPLAEVSTDTPAKSPLEELAAELSDVDSGSLFTDQTQLIIHYQQKAWNEFLFTSKVDVSEPESLIYKWDFGDGSKGFDSQIFHAYSGSGDFVVNVEVLDSKGNKIEAALPIVVSFFNAGNTKFLFLVLGLFLFSILMTVLGVLLPRLLTSKESEASPVSPKETEEELVLSETSDDLQETDSREISSDSTLEDPSSPQSEEPVVEIMPLSKSKKSSPLAKKKKAESVPAKSSKKLTSPSVVIEDELDLLEASDADTK